MNPAVEMKLYKSRPDLWAVSRVLIHCDDKMKRLVWSELDAESKRILTDAKAESDAMVSEA